MSPHPASPTCRHLRAITASLLSDGAKPVHVERLLKAWIRGRPLGLTRDFRESPLPDRIVARLDRIRAELDSLARIASVHPGDDGSERLVLALIDGEMVESVLLLREGVCVSTQVGCAVGCLFCQTGKSGLVRQLSSGEILAQVALARQRRPLRRVVFMGMGEPSHNLPAVLEALSVLGGDGGFGHKNLVFSTVGDRELFARLAAHDVKPAIALSLHTTNAQLRAELLPKAARVAPDELVALADDYARRTGHPIQYQWTLLEGVNDGEADIARAIELLQGRRGVLNFIPYNSVDGLAYARPSLDRAREIVRRVHRSGVLAKLRRSAGQDVEGACGQLRARRIATPQ